MAEESPADSRRKRHQNARREQIVSAAARVFAEKGYHRATTQDIAQEAEVSEGTIYNYFTSKDELLLAIVNRLGDLQDLEERLSNATAGDARSLMNTILHERLEFTQQNFDMLRATLSEILVNPQLSRRYYQELILPTLAALEQFTQRLVEEHRIQAIEAPLVSRVLIGASFGLVLLRSLDDPITRVRWDELDDVMTLLFFDGLNPK